jgi:hypothetical protein
MAPCRRRPFLDDRMLLMIGAGLIGVTWCFLLGLILASRFTTGRWLTDAAVAERITVFLIAGFAVGLICVELHPASSAAAASGTLEIALLLATLGGFALMWSWFRLCEGPRSDPRHRPRR